MQLRGEQLAAHLERGLLPVYLLYGDEPLLTIEAADAIRAAAHRHGFSEREVLTVLPGFDWSSLYHAAGNLSLFGDKKLIDLRLPSGKPGRDGSAALQDYCKRLSPEVVLLVTLPALDWTEEKAVWVKALSEAGAALKLNAPPLSALPEWIAQRLKRQGHAADTEALQFIVERVEGNLLAAHQEILKLGLLYPAGRLTLSEVSHAILNVARYDLEDLREALLVGDIARLSRTLEGLKQEGEPPPLVLWALTEEVRALAEVTEGLKAHKPLETLLKEARVFGNRQTLFRQALKRVNRGAAARALIHAAMIDKIIKGARQGDLWNECLQLALSLAHPRATLRASS